MKITLLWNAESIGNCDLDVSSLETTEFFSIVSAYWELDGIAVGFRLFGDDTQKSIDLAKPEAVKVLMETVPSRIFRCRIHTNLNGPDEQRYIQLNGPWGQALIDINELSVHYHMDIGEDGEGSGFINIEGQEIWGQFHALCNEIKIFGFLGRHKNNGVFWSEYHDLRGVIVVNNGDTYEDLQETAANRLGIQVSLGGSGIHGTIILNGPNLRGRVDVDWPKYLIYESFPDSWRHAVASLTAFIAKLDAKNIAFNFGTFCTPKTDLSPQAKQILAELLPIEQPLPLVARRALLQYTSYFEQFIREQPSEAALALAQDVTTHMLAHAPIEDDSPPRESVRLGVCAPRSAAVGSSFLTNFVAYAPELEEVITQQLLKKNPQAVAYLDSQRLAWQCGIEVQVHVYGKYLKIEPNHDQFVWNGEKEQIDFEVNVSMKAPMGQTTLKTDVYIEGVRIKRIWLPLDITPQHSVIVPEMALSSSDAPKSAFVSYASTDRPRVLDRIASLIIHTGMDVVMDCITLRPNQRWRDLIPKLILESNILLLFWSQDAAKSKWVDWEWRHAFEHKGISAIEIHPLTPYSTAPLPSELSELQGDDPLMHYREWDIKQSQKAWQKC